MSTHFIHSVVMATRTGGFYFAVILYFRSRLRDSLCVDKGFGTDSSQTRDRSLEASAWDCPCCFLLLELSGASKIVN